MLNNLLSQGNSLNEQQVFVGQLLNWMVKQENRSYLETLGQYLEGLYTNDSDALQVVQQLMRNVANQNGDRDFSTQQAVVRHGGGFNNMFTSQGTQGATPGGSDMSECDSHRDCGLRGHCANRTVRRHPNGMIINHGNCEPCPTNLHGLWATYEDNNDYEVGHNNQCVRNYLSRHGSANCADDGCKLPGETRCVDAPLSHRNLLDESPYSGYSGDKCV